MNKTFSQEVIAGLSKRPKHLSSKYFYNQEGDKIFQHIMAMPEYYLTRSEFNVLDENKQDLLQHFRKNGEAIDLVEFGAGDGLKTKILLNHFLEQEANFSYIPIDISDNALSLLVKDLKKNLPDLKVKSIQGEYFKALQELNRTDTNKKIVLFLGSNIGNFEEKGALQFLEELRSSLKDDDMVLIGFDLKKDPDVILKAYNDAAGITRDFNLNLLERINDELGANFDVKGFKHYPYYDPVSGACRSHLVSVKKQEVEFADHDEVISFEEWEPIYMELSQKYDQEMINKYAEKSGFKVVDNFFDSKRYYLNSLWSLK